MFKDFAAQNRVVEKQNLENQKNREENCGVASKNSNKIHLLNRDRYASLGFCW